MGEISFLLDPKASFSLGLTHKSIKAQLLGFELVSERK
jgi:hypothetical protein